MITFSVLTYNIHSGRDAKKKYNLGAIIAVLKASGADILGLQEVDCKFHLRSNWEDQVKILSDTLGMKTIFGPAIVFGDKKGEYGNLLLTNMPIIDHKTVTMSLGAHSKVKYDGTSNTEPRSYIFAEVDIGSGQVGVISTHLSFHSKEERLQQIKTIEKEIQEFDKPLILMGDLNTTEDSEEFSIFNTYLSNPSEGKTFITKPDEERQIDFILTRGLRTEKIEVIESDASDHYPVLAKFSLE